MDDGHSTEVYEAEKFDSICLFWNTFCFRGLSASSEAQ